MARTSSVPHLGSIAAVGGARSQQNAQHWELKRGRGLHDRGVFLLLAAVLTGIGGVIPHVDIDVLPTVLFVARAGLAALVVILPWPASTAEELSSYSQHEPTDVRSSFCAKTARQVRFPELLSGSPRHPSLDRVAWAKLTAHMSHELRTPLNAVLGFSELMANEMFGPLGSSYGTYARDIHASGRTLLKSAEDALAITALLTAPERKSTRDVTCIRKAIDDACAFMAPDLADRAIIVEINTAGSLDALGDQQAMRQMLINLVSEAGRNGMAGASLRIETTSDADAINLSLSLVAGDHSKALDEGFAIMLARTFCELCGAELTTGLSADGEWFSTVRLSRAAQADLFAAA
jgi:hypothetical protein